MQNFRNFLSHESLVALAHAVELPKGRFMKYENAKEDCSGAPTTKEWIEAQIRFFTDVESMREFDKMSTDVQNFIMDVYETSSWTYEDAPYIHISEMTTAQKGSSIFKYEVTLQYASNAETFMA